jgi:NTP pyrophosphatase (non-canonical NTP hydrolase)
MSGLSLGQDLTWDDYQDRAEDTSGNAGACNPWRKLLAAACLAEEAAELMKALWALESPLLDYEERNEWVKAVKEEIGDLLWYIAEAASSQGLRLEAAAHDAALSCRPPQEAEIYRTDTLWGFYWTVALHDAAEVADLAELALTLAIEAGAYTGMVKKQVAHGHILTGLKALHQLGRVLYVAAQIAYEFHVDLGSIGIANLEKLATRYPAGFSEEASRNRDR